ncbi:MAG: FMN-binding glutamate synthase family protein, partial [Saprospiraceae bacterium]|nr:FMN-binding glutamate synthase family protein [Saprospiraceae bacterium]
IESDTNGTPLNRVERSVVYQRAKQERDTSPFGTQMNVYEEGYEWMSHSIGALDAHQLDADPRVLIGGPDCSLPYSCSVLNVSAMSYGSLSKAAIEALNGGAAKGNFAHNTGEGGISPYHVHPGGDLIYQIGTGYFGSRCENGYFSPDQFTKQAAQPSVKMIELKLSQGAKPGHGGILPGKKNTIEIAKIRGVKPGLDVLSPPYHTAFSTPKELISFIAQLRELSGGKPVGFKLCVGHRSEFIAICKAMVDLKCYPDFITVDGAEGGTGAAPVEFSDSVGMPFREGLAFVHDTLIGFGIREHIKIMAAGKIMTGFHLFRAMALGADVGLSARAMMLALGCIQALECNKNTCPTGVATQEKELVAGLVVADKTDRVSNYHRETVESLVELLAAAGLHKPAFITRQHILRRISMNQVQSYHTIFPKIEKGVLLHTDSVPISWKTDWLAAHTDSFTPVY